MKLLVLGGTGLISEHIVRQAVAAGHEVTAFNRGQTDIALPGSVQYLHGDRHDVPSLIAAISDAGPFDAAIDMIAFTAADVRGFVDACAPVCRHLVFCSTVDVYDRRRPRFPIREDAPQFGLGSYASNKIEAEALFVRLSRERNFRFTIVRPAHTYSDRGSLVHSLGWSSVLLDRLAKGKPVIVHGDGSSLWASCRAEDVAQAFVACVGNPASYDRAFTTASDEVLPWSEIYREIARGIGAPEPNIVPIPTDALLKLAPDRAAVTGINFRYHALYDMTAAREALGFRVTISLAEGARRTYSALKAGQIVDSDVDRFDDDLLARWAAVTGL